MPRTPLFTRGSLLFLLLLGAGLLWLVFTYQPQPKITGVKGGSLRPVMVTYIWFNEGSWSAPNGIYYANPRIPPAAGGGATLSSRYLPTQVEARWYDPVQQCFYEAVLLAPDMEQKARAVLKTQPKPYRGKYTLKLIPFLRGSDLEIWLHGDDENYFHDLQEFTELLSVAHGQKVPGDAAQYTAAVKLLIREKKIPADTPLPGSKE